MLLSMFYRVNVERFITQQAKVEKLICKLVTNQRANPRATFASSFDLDASGVLKRNKGVRRGLKGFKGV